MPKQEIASVQGPDLQTNEAILDSITDGVFTVDREWKITSFNRAASEITGVAREEAIGRSCCEVFKATICETECALRRTLETGLPVIAKHVFIISAEGRRVPISVSTAILKDPEDRVIGGVETFRDLSQVEELRKELEERYSFADIIGRSTAMRRLFDVVPDIAQSQSTILIQGASGTGKELFARAIHDLSPRRNRRFVAINCGALPDTLLESELFGYKAGAFTDARRDKPGRFVLAEGGTIFLDEIGDISPAMQSRLLRVLQDRLVEPLGSVQPIKVDVRVISATNKNLEELVKQGRFREDLYYRVNVFSLSLPLLRERREDIPLLIEHFVSRFNRRRNRKIAGVTEDTMSRLLNYDYPGNVRELENIIEHAFVLCRGWFIEPRHLPILFRDDAGQVPPAEVPAGTTLRDWEIVHILDAVKRNGGNRTAAARELGINPSTLFRKVKALQIKLPEIDGRSRME
jgi:PAS domain S-box-containing protein